MRSSSTRLVLGTLLVALGACEQPPGPDAAPSSIGTASFGPGPSQYLTVPVQVAPALAAAPFDVTRSLTIPAGFSIKVYQRVSNARFMRLTPDGNLLVSDPTSGSLILLRPNGSGIPLKSTFATGLARPHDMVFYKSGGTTWLYVSEKNKVRRAPYLNGSLTIGALQTVVANLPDRSLPELGGKYGHELKHIAIDKHGFLYVSIGSTCNVCIEDTQSNPVRASVYRFNADGSGGRLYARGLRNAVGLAIVPGRNTLWAVVNNRDQVPYPFNDASGNYGRVFAGYVDDNPPDLFTRVRDGGNYGWPFCNSNPNTAGGLDSMPFNIDFNLNSNGAVNCAAMDPPTKGIPAHSAPLGLTFMQGSLFPPRFRKGAMVALHGSWNRTVFQGGKVVFFPWDPSTQRPGPQYDFVSGWLSNNTYWGRPVDTVVEPGGGLFISDNLSGTIYLLWKTGVIP